MMHYFNPPKNPMLDVKAEGMLLDLFGGRIMVRCKLMSQELLFLDQFQRKKILCTGIKIYADFCQCKIPVWLREVILIFFAREPLGRWRWIIVVEPDAGGYFLVFMEGPNAFRWRSNPENLDAVLQPRYGHHRWTRCLCSGKYGIMQNMLICKNGSKMNRYGAFFISNPWHLYRSIWRCWPFFI